MNKLAELTVGELLQRVGAGEVPLSAHVTVTWDALNPPLSADLAARREAALEAGRIQAEKDANMTPEELEAERALFDQLYHNMNETRRELGMRKL